MKILLLGFALWSCAGIFAGEYFPPVPGKTDIDRALARGAEYLTTNCLKNGEFVYRRNLTPRLRYRYKNNLLRHAGAVYALGLVRDFWEKNPRLAPPSAPERANAAIARANAFLRQSIHPVSPNSEMLAIWSDEAKMDITALPGSPNIAKLGAAGLGLLALLAEKAPPGDPLPTARKIAAFIVSLQTPEGAFVSRVIAGKDDDEEFDSLYYPGEAMLGLLRLYARDGDARWLAAVTLGMRHLARSRRAAGSYPPDHWALLASAALWKLRTRWEGQDCGSGLTVADLCGHAAEVSAAMLAEQWTIPSLPGEFGCFRIGGLTCPTATRVEGLMAAYEFLPVLPYGNLRERLKHACGHAAGFLLKAQVTAGSLCGGIPRSSTDDVLRHAPAERRRAGEIRIDYVQHTLAGLLAFRRAAR